MSSLTMVRGFQTNHSIAALYKPFTHISLLLNVTGKILLSLTSLYFWLTESLVTWPIDKC